MPFTPQAKRLLELSLEKAEQLGHKHVSAEHLLLGLMTEGQSIAPKIIDSLGVDPGSIRQVVQTSLRRWEIRIIDLDSTQVVENRGDRS